jgi:hypothetical protein
MQHDDTPHKHVGTLPSDGGMKVLEGSTTVLCTHGDVSISEGLYILSNKHVKAVMVQWFQQQPTRVH